MYKLKSPSPPSSSWPKTKHTVTAKNEIWFTHLYVCMFVRLNVCTMCVHLDFVYMRNDDVWLMYAVIVVDTLRTKRILFWLGRVCRRCLCTWPMKFSIWRLYNKIALFPFLRIGFAELDYRLPKHGFFTTFFDVILFGCCCCCFFFFAFSQMLVKIRFIPIRM